MWHGRPRGGGRAPRPRLSLVRAGTGHIFAALRVLLSFLRWGLQDVPHAGHIAPPGPELPRPSY